MTLFSLREISIAKVPRKSWQMYAKPAKTPHANIGLNWGLPALVAIILFSILVAYNYANNRSNVQIAFVQKAVSIGVNKPPKSMARSTPTHLHIPAIQVDSDLITLGLNPNGTIEVPATPNFPGWYKYGPSPGEVGPAIVVGHLDSPNNVAVFWRLHELQSNDKIHVFREDGTTAQFTVKEVSQLPRDSFPTEKVYGNITYAGIRLITCGGTFNYQTRQYDHNTVVFGTLE